MDDLLKAITGLINTGGALADDALYLYFIMRTVAVVAIPASIWAIGRGIILPWVRVYMQKHGENLEAELKVELTRYWTKNPSQFGYDPFSRESWKKNEIAKELAAQARRDA